MTLDNKREYISNFTIKLERRTQSYMEDISILHKHGIINYSTKQKLDLLYDKWFYSNVNADNSNEFTLIINLMYKAIKDYEAK